MDIGLLPQPVLQTLLHKRLRDSLLAEEPPSTGLTRINLFNGISNVTSNFGTGPYVTGTFTPPNNSLLVAVVAAVEAGGSDQFLPDLTIAGASLTYTNRIQQGASTGFSTGIVIYTAPVTSGTSMAITLDCAARDMGFYAITVVAYTNYNTSSPTGVTASGFLDSGIPGPPTPTSITLSGPPAITSEVIAGVAMDKNRQDVTPGIRWQEIYDINNQNWGGIQVQFRNTSVSTLVDWVDLRPTDSGSGALFNWADVALEIKQTAGAADQPIAGNGIPSDQNVGSPSITLNIVAHGITTVEKLGNSAVAPGAVTVSVNGIASSESLGNTNIATASSILANGITTEERVGSPTVTTLTTISANGISSAERFGAAEPATVISAGGITGSERFGNTTAIPGSVTISTNSIHSESLVGYTQVSLGALALNISAHGIASTASVGQPYTGQEITTDVDWFNITNILTWIDDSDSLVPNSIADADTVIATVGPN